MTVPLPGARDGARFTAPVHDPEPEIALFTWTLESCAAVARRFEPLLSPDERARRDRFHDPRNGARFASGRAELRRILAAELGTEPEALQFRYNPHGKPELDGPGRVQFNLSHSQDRVVLALSRTHVVGVDIEVPRPFGEDVARVAFTEAERAALAQLPDDERRVAFYRNWTCKEAVVKALGCGLSLPPTRLSIAFDHSGEARLTALDPAFGHASRWRIHQLDCVPGCVAALAVQPLPGPGCPRPLEGTFRRGAEAAARSSAGWRGAEHHHSRIRMRTIAWSPLESSP